MNDRHDDILHTLSETKELLGDFEVPAGDDFSIEDILSEFGQGEAEPAPKRKKPQSAAPAEEPAPVPEPAAEAEPPREEKELPREEKESRVSLEDLMAQTVDAVLEENEDTAPRKTVKQRWNALRDGVEARTAAVGAAVSARINRKKTPAAAAVSEPEMDQLFREENRRCKRLTRQLVLGAIPLAVLLAVSVAHTWFGQYIPSLWQQQALLRCGVMGGGLLLTLAFTPAVWKGAIAAAKEKRVGAEAAALLCAFAVLCHCVYGAVTQDLPQLPLSGIAALMLWLCVAGQRSAARSRREGYRLGNIGGAPPYCAVVSAAGATKRKGTLRGFYTAAQQLSPAERVNVLLLPLLLAAATVLAGVVCIGGDRVAEFCYVWSALLCASVPLSLSLCGTLPLRKLNRRLGRNGCAVAGYSGAKAISTSGRLVATDADLFPPGMVVYDGMQAYNEDTSKMISYAAAVSREAGSHLWPLFDQLLSQEGGVRYKPDDLLFCEEGAFGGTIHGETVMLGSAYFMKSRHMTMPRDLKKKYNLFLSVDGQVKAAFAIRYDASRSVEWALRALRRSRIEPVLAVRGGNITPGMLKNKFKFDAKPIYPDVYTRVELSEDEKEQAQQADALIYREGLMPFAETVIGSRRCCRMVKWSAALSWFGSLCGILLSYYLSSVSAFNALNAGYILVFALLWLLPTLLLADLVRRY